MTSAQHDQADSPVAGGTALGTAPVRPLRRSKDDRVGGGVAGGLGEFFGIDPIIFRVLFVALSFLGLAGVALYMICYAVIPEKGAANSTLDRGVAAVRQRGKLGWVVAAAALVVAWAALFSWWSPFPVGQLLLVAAVLALGLSRIRPGGPHQTEALRTPPAPFASQQPTAAYPIVDPPVSLEKHDGDADTEVIDPSIAGYQIPDRVDAEPAAIPTTSNQLRDWWAQRQTERKRRNRRGWVTEAAADGLIVAVWLILGLVSLGMPVPVQAFLWSGFGIILGCTLIGAALRRPRWRMLVGVGVLAALIAAIGTYPIRIGDPTGQQEWRPATVSDVKADYRMLGGEELLDVTGVDFADRVVNVRITQGAGHIKVTVPADVDVVLEAKVRFGELVAFGNVTRGTQNHRSETDLGTDGAGGGTLHLTVELLAGQVEIVRG
jgi:phage shock protein PspC (stress-responsive transcriptional regulator)